MWARTCEIGCAIVECKNHHIFADYVYYFLYLMYSGNLQMAVRDSYYVVVCKYAPGNPNSTRRPYKRGMPCRRCPRNARLCDQSFGNYTYTPLESEVGGQEVDEIDDSMSTGLCCQFALSIKNTSILDSYFSCHFCRSRLRDVSGL